CALLELPAELRANIYRFALCEETKIANGQDSFQQPAILWTCRQVRQEASTNRYVENRFLLPTHNFDL
ncbi:hypothetical protein DOTSEDRAFT_107919, partial [Dothistroma septosporum NZE10]